MQEIKNWYVRWYQKLSTAQKADIRALGKGGNYLDLWRLK